MNTALNRLRVLLFGIALALTVTVIHTTQAEAAGGDLTCKTSSVPCLISSNLLEENFNTSGPMGVSLDGTVRITLGTESTKGVISCVPVIGSREEGSCGERPAGKPVEFTITHTEDGFYGAKFYHYPDPAKPGFAGWVKASWEVDVTPPKIYFDDAIKQGLNAEFTFNGSADALGFECSLDEGEWEPCNSGLARYRGLAPGEHVFRARAYDEWGRYSDVLTRTWTIKPHSNASGWLLQINRKPKRKVRAKRVSVRFRQIGLSSARFRCRLDRGRWRACKPGKRMTLRAPRYGRHRFVVVARYADGTILDRDVARWKRVKKKRRR